MNELNPLQTKLLKMLAWFHEYCVANDIKYYIAEGTMLGAARHQGYIPWDDDIDVVLPREDYEKLLRLFRGQIENYIIETPYSEAEDYRYTFAKLYDTTTTVIEHMAKDCKRGIYIDIFPLDGMGETIKESISNFKKIDRRNMFLMMRTCALRKGRKLYKNIAIVLARMIPSCIVNEKKLAQEIDRISASFGYERSKYVLNHASTYREKEIMGKEIYGIPTEYAFENITVFGVENYEEYLSRLYGDWRKLPPLEKRCSAHEFMLIDLNKSFLSN